MVRKLGTAAKTRGIRNNNPFNIRKSENSWLGKLKHSSDKDFEQFQTIWHGLRAGFQLLRNGYLAKGFDTPERILYKFAPAIENDTEKYIAFVCTYSPLKRCDVISLNSISFFWLCKMICKYESQYDLTYDNFSYVVTRFNLW